MIRALFGGSFDPFHEGHLAIVEVLRTRGLCDVVHVTPAWRSPFKDSTSATGAHRLAMVRLALEERDGVEIEDLEILRSGPSYTIETLRTLQSRHHGDRWRIVMGADSYEGLMRWREPEAILEAARPLVLARRGSAPDVGPEADLIEDFDVPVSSTEVRRQLASTTLDAVRVPAAVAAYIREHGLYGLDAAGDSGGSPCP